MSGLDRAIIRARTHPDLPGSYTGVVSAVDGHRLHELLALGITPVIAPLCISEDGQNPFNVNADHVAAAVAGAIRAERLFFLTDVPGVQDADGTILRQLDAPAAQALQANGVIHHGMLPKVQSALSALKHGANAITIGDLDALRKGTGTTLLDPTQETENQSV